MHGKRFEPKRCAVPAGESLIAAGLAMLLAAAVMPQAPVATGLACIALGATQATLARSYGPNRLPFMLAVHLVVYTNLYVLLLGAVCQAAATGSASGVAWLRGLDVICSLLPMALGVRAAIAGLGNAEDPAAR